MNPDLAMLPPERALPPQRFAAARGQLESVVTTRLRRFSSRWRLGAVVGLGVGLTVGGGVALANGVFSHRLPGAPKQTPLARTVTATHTGTATVELGLPPRSANSLSLTLTGLSVGTYRFPNGSTMGCAKSDLASRPFGCQTMAVEPLVAGQHSITIAASANVTWRLQAVYVKEVVTPWKTNALGETYGVPNGHGFPDLVAVSFDQGKKSGYAKWADLNCDWNGPGSSPPAQGSDAAATNLAIPVYKSNGTTRIGTFVIGEQSPGTRTIPLSSVKCNGPTIPQSHPISGLPGG
jgi:hypothetical protein